MKKMFLVALAACISLILAGCANGLADSDEATISFTFPAEIVKSTIENDTTVSCSLNAMLYDAKSNELIEAKTVTVSSTNDIVINFSPITVGRSIFISVEYYKGTVLYASGFSKKQVVVEGTQSVTITLTRTDNGETITGTGIITGKSTISDVSDNSNTIVYIEKKTTGSIDNSISSIATSSSSSITIKNVIAQTKAAKDGSFSFTGLAAGSYSVYAVNGATLEQAAFDTVSVENDKTTEVTLTFTAVGTIAGTVTINESPLDNDGLIVYIPGTNYVAVTNTDGTFVMTSVPATSVDATYEVYALYNGNVYTVASSVTVTGGETTMLESYNISVQSLNVSYVSCRATDKGILFNGYVPHLYYNQSNSSGSDTVNVTIKDLENDIEATKTVITDGKWTVCYPFVTKGKEYTFNIQYTDKNYNNSYKDSITVTATGGYGEYKVANPTELKPVLSSDRVVSRTGTVQFEGDYTGAISRSGYTFDLARGTSWSDNNSMWLFEAKLYKDNSDGTYPLKKLQTLSNWRSFDYVDAMLKGNDYFLTTKTVIQVPMCPNWNFNMNDYQIVTNKWGGDRAKVLTIYGVVVDGDSRYLSYDADNLKDKVEMDKIIAERGLKGMPGTPATVSMGLKEGDNKKTVYYNTAVSYFGDRVYFPSEAPSGNKYRFDYWRFDSVSNLDFDQELTHTTSTEIVTATINGVSGEYYVDYMSAVFVMVGPVTVTLNYNGGATSSVTTVLKDNGTSSWNRFELPTALTRDGFVFAGWSLDLTSDETWSGTVTIEDDVTYYAKWVYDSSMEVTE